MSDSIFTKIKNKEIPGNIVHEDDICFGEPSYNLVNATPNGGTYFINNEMTSFFDVENLDFGAYKIRYEYTDPATNCYNEITDTTLRPITEVGRFRRRRFIDTKRLSNVQMLKSSAQFEANLLYPKRSNLDLERPMSPSTSCVQMGNVNYNLRPLNPLEKSESEVSPVFD